MPAVVPRSYGECQRLYAAELSRLANEAFDLYCANPCRTLYLFGTTRDGNFARGYFDLTIGEDGDELILSDYIPRHLPKEAMIAWFHDNLCRTPLWVFCD